jgi:signal transduction histidine kinase
MPPRRHHHVALTARAMTEPDAAAALERRLLRERAARREAEAIAERVTSELYGTSLELRQANDDLQSLNAALREFVAIASHDLRGPLTGILGMASLLHRRWDDLDAERRRDCLASIERQGHVLQRLVEDLLTVSRIEAGAIDIAAETLLLRSAVTTLVDDTAGADDGVEVLGEDVAADVDPDHLRRIVGNYLGNAIKYGASPIRVEIREADGWAEILVRDSGAGIPEDFVPRLFGKFARGERSRDKGGTGLGLSIVQGLARANGGDAWYEPNEPHGSCFGVRFRSTAA